MQVTVEDVSQVKKTLHIEIPEDEVTRELDAAYQNLKKTAKIKGFRPGKAPRNVLERMFKKDVHADVTSKLINSSFIEAIKEKDLNIVGNPKLDPPDLSSSGPYKYEATIEINPEIDNIDYSGLTLKKTIYEAGEEEVNAQLKMIQKSLAQQEPIEDERPAEKGDFTLIDYEGFKDGKPFEDTQKTVNFTVKIGEGSIHTDFDDGLSGMTPGEEKEIKIDFPKDYSNEKLAGHEITFRVKLNQIMKEVFPEIDDELAKKMGQYETLDELKKAIDDNLKNGYAKRTEQELNEQIFKALIEKTEFEVPSTMVDYELEGILAEAERSFQYRNMSMEEMGITRESLSEKYRDTAEKQVRRHLILDKIIKQEDLNISDDELEQGFKEMAENFNQPVDEIKNYYKQNKDKIEFFKHTLLEKKAIKLIMDTSTVDEVKPEKVKESVKDK